MSLATRIRLPYSLESLPWFARLYKGAFRSGGASPGLTRLVSRLLYYAYEITRLPVGQGRLTLNVRGQDRSVCFDPRNRQFNSLYFDRYARGYEPEVAALLAEFLPCHGVFYDVGSNWGYFALLVATNAAFSGKVHAFEPWPPSYANLQDLIRQTALQDWVTCHQLALGDSARAVSMRCGRHSGLARVTGPDAQGTVAQRPLDSLALEAPDFIKLDTEGTELAILRGGRQTLRQHRPMLVFEHACDELPAVSLELLAQLERWGYQTYVPLLECRDSTTRKPRLLFGHEWYFSGCCPEGLRLHAVGPGTRSTFPSYLNLFACHRGRVELLRPYLLDALEYEQLRAAV